MQHLSPSAKWERGDVRNVLDHGYVKLVDFMGNDVAIIEAARMSTNKGFEGWEPGAICKRCRVRQGDPESNSACVVMMSGIYSSHDWERTKGDAHLLEFLYKNSHMTPFEMGQLVIEVQAPLMVFREWHRHRTQSYNEMSARYIQMPNLHYVPDISRIQRQSTTNKQGSAEPFPEDEAKAIIANLMMEQGDIYTQYDVLVEEGLSKEVARINTPVSRYSRMRASANLRNWLAFMTLRMSPKAQWEIREYANIVADIIASLWPRTYELFEEYTFYASRVSRTGMQKLAARLGMTVEEVTKEFCF